MGYDCPIISSGMEFIDIDKHITKSIHFLKALKSHMETFETESSKTLVKKYKKSFEVEGGLPFLKGKYKQEEK